MRQRLQLRAWAAAATAVAYQRPFSYAIHLNNLACFRPASQDPLWAACCIVYGADTDQPPLLETQGHRQVRIRFRTKWHSMYVPHVVLVRLLPLAAGYGPTLFWGAVLPHRTPRSACCSAFCSCSCTLPSFRLCWRSHSYWVENHLRYWCKIRIWALCWSAWHSLLTCAPIRAWRAQLRVLGGRSACSLLPCG